MDLELGGKAAVVTGAAQGIGLAVARAFLGEGARVLMVDRNPAVVDIAKDAGGTPLVTDLGDAGADRSVADAGAMLGACAVLVNNAGISRPAHIDAITDDDWRAVMSVNVDVAFRLTRTLWPQLLQAKGAIVNIASFAGKRATLFGNNASYVASKHAIIGLTRAAAMDGARGRRARQRGGARRRSDRHGQASRRGNPRKDRRDDPARPLCRPVRDR